jgi:hypothetical protein
VLTPKEITEKESITINAVNGIRDSQTDGVGIFSLEMLLFMSYFAFR